MTDPAVPYGRKTQRPPAIPEIDVLWITAGLGCDGDTIAMTAATQPSIEDLVLGAIPGMPAGPAAQPRPRLRERRRLHEALAPGRRGQARPLPPRRRGVDPQREEQGRGLLGGPRHRPGDRPADHDLRLDRPPGAAGLGGGRGRHLRHLRRHPRDGRQPDRLHGPARLPRLAVEVAGRHPHRLRARLPGAAGQLHGDAALPALPGGRAGADDPARRHAAADLAVRPDRPRGLRPGRLLRAGRLRRPSTARPSASSSSAAGGRWCSATSASAAGWTASAAAPTSAAICIGCTMPGFPDKFMPFMDEPPGAKLSTAAVAIYGRTVRRPAPFTQASLNKEPDWRHPRRS